MEYTENEVIRSQFARIQKVTPPTVNEYEKDGRLVLTDDNKRVKVKESIERLAATKKLHGVFRNRQAEAERNAINAKVEKTKEPENFEKLNEQVSESQLSLDGNDADTLFKNAKALREKAAAMQGAADYEKSIGKLVEREVVDKIIFERARQFRDGLMTWKRRIAPELVGKDNIHEIEDLLERDIRFLLNEFSKLPVID